MELDLWSAGRIWERPSDVDEGEVEILGPDQRAGLGIPDESLPPIGDLIRPIRRVSPPAKSGPYAFMCEVDGEPIRWRASGPLRYLLRQAAAPPNGVDIVRRCLQQLADATGLLFEFGGTVPGIPEGALDENTLVVAWAFDDEFEAHREQHGLPERAIGFGGPRWVLGSGSQPRLIAGMAVLNTEMALPPTADGGATHGAVLLHELGHAMNLDHVTSDEEIMYPVATRRSSGRWGPGDRMGLFLIGEPT